MCSVVFMDITIVIMITSAIIGKAIFTTVTTTKPYLEIFKVQEPRFSQSLLRVIIYTSSCTSSYLAVTLFLRFLHLLDDSMR